MKRFQFSKGKSKGLLVLLLLLGLSLPGQIYAQAEKSHVLSEITYTSADSQTGDFIPDQILVKFTQNLSSEQRIQYIHQVTEVSLLNEIPQLGVSVLRVPNGRTAETIARFKSFSDVLYAEPNFVARMTDTIPSDPGWGNQYGLSAIHAPQGWDLTTGSTSVTIAIVDTGVDLAHVDLAAKIGPGYDFVNNDALPQDDNRHGTHVAGIAAAIGNNGIGVAGVSWGARIMPVKVLDAFGNGSYANVAAGITWAADNGAQVINLSLGGTDPSSVLEDAINYVYGKGVTVVAAAGNSGSSSILYPARYPHVIAVGATDSSNNHASFSNIGPELDVAAPGVDIYSTLIGNNYGYLSGTSMATPFVTGLAAILVGFPGNNSPDTIVSEIETAALDLGLPGRDDLYGYGLIQMDAAIQTVWSPSTPTYTPTVTATATSTDTPQPTSTFEPSDTFTSTPSPTATFTPTTQSLPLVTDWNLVSFNLHPNSTAITDVLSNIAGNYDLVYAWDASGAHSGSANWMRYAPGIPGNTLSTLDESMGFWIRMTNADTLDIVGSAPTTTNICLSTAAGGWNLVGYPSAVNRRMPDALSMHGVTDYTMVYAYHANDADTWKRYAPGVPGNDLLEVAPAWAYWIKVEANDTWDVIY